MNTEAAPSAAGPDLLRAHLQRLPGGPLGRPVHLWSYGPYGRPVIAYPTAGGYAHAWQHNGMVEVIFGGGDACERAGVNLSANSRNFRK